MDKLNSKSLDVELMNIGELKKLFPSIVVEGKIDFDKLRLLLGEEVDDSMEKYQFIWKGKNKAIKLAQTPSTETLRPDKEDSKNWDTTENLYIEGDNLEVLKQLQKTYFGKVKMIYIDPPYNTGNNILYKNDFSVNPDEMKKLQKESRKSEGEYFKNSISSASFHTEWLNIMYPRLTLTKNLLTEDGFAVIAIDHNELMNLIKITDEVFGEYNRLGIITVVHKPEGRNQEKFFATSNEYMVFYAKNKDICKLTSAILDDDKLASFDREDSKGKYRLNNFIRLGGGDANLRKNKPHFYYPIWVSQDLTKISDKEEENFIAVYPNTNSQERTWKVTKETFITLLNNDELIATKDSNNNIIVNEKYRIDKGQLIKTHWISKKYNAINQGTKILENLMGTKTFDFPKSLYLLIDTLKITTSLDSIVLDLFSGSATTAHAVMQLNAEDGGNRKFIMVQLPEKTDEKSEAYKAGYKNICEIGKERIRRAGEQIKKELIEKKQKAGMLDENIIDPNQLDIGFKVFKLDETNIKPWDSSLEVDEKTLLSQIEVIKENRTKEDVLHEILLKYGVFNEHVKELSMNGQTIYSIAENYMIVNLNDRISSDDIKSIAQLKPSVVVFLENGFADDNQKINAEATLKHQGIEDVKCI